MILFDGVTFQYPNQARPALTSIDWSVTPGAVALVTGPTGSGKSTLARCINGLIPHFHGGRFGGYVLVNGLRTTEQTTAMLSRHAGFVAQIPESQTVTDRVEDEIAFGLENLGIPRSQMRLRVEEMLDLLNLNGLRRRRMETLSGGERQRVVIAAAMAMRPPILVLDEPTSQLDPASAEEILSILQHMNHELGTTIILVEHRLDRLVGMSDQLLVMNQTGGIDAAGPVCSMIEKLQSPPPLVRIARELGWVPPPLTVRDARAFKPPFPSCDDSIVGQSRGSGRNGTPSVVFESVTFGYQRDPVLDGLSVAFNAGSITGLMGRNGSGKTTLLKLVNGLLRPDKGRIRVFGNDVAKSSTTDLAETIGYLPQNAATLLFNDTVEEELRFTLRCRQQTGDISAMLERFDIAALARRNPLDLSGGERLRAALAAVLIGRPRILLLDEPTRGADARLKHELGGIFRELANEGMTVILATHDVDLVAEFADRVLVLGDGEVVADGSPYDVMPGSLTFATQVNRVFGGRLLTVDDVLRACHRGSLPA